MNAAPAASIAERKRQLVRGELAEAAVTLLACQGFDETTVDQIVAAVGMLRRTFSRYFQSKEDVVVHLLAGSRRADVRGTARPARRRSKVLALALRHALSAFTAVCGADPERTLHVSRLILDTPALLARFLERQSHWQAEMAAILARRTGLVPVPACAPPWPPRRPHRVPHRAAPLGRQRRHQAHRRTGRPGLRDDHPGTRPQHRPELNPPASACHRDHSALACVLHRSVEQP